MPVTESWRTAPAKLKGIRLWMFSAWIVFLPVLASGQQAKDSEHPQGKWEVLEGCRLVTNAVIDGDSFHIIHKGREYIFRLYFVDAPEADASLTERVKDQAAYFGISATNIPRGGVLAGRFARDKLSGRPFTVVTRWNNAMGRSKLARYYGIVLVQGKNLAEELVSNGLARVYGLRANWPEGARSTTIINKLKNLELTAREQRRGLWDEQAFPRDANFGSALAVKKAVPGGVQPVDLNEASYEELKSVPGIGPKLAERIMANRPYHTVDDALKVPGIGAKSLEKMRPFLRVEGVEGEK